jgi:hypothetical protein
MCYIQFVDGPSKYSVLKVLGANTMSRPSVLCEFDVDLRYFGAVGGRYDLSIHI